MSELKCPDCGSAVTTENSAFSSVLKDAKGDALRDGVSLFATFKVEEVKDPSGSVKQKAKEVGVCQDCFTEYQSKQAQG